jgi:hypothetical protein
MMRMPNIILSILPSYRNDDRELTNVALWVVDFLGREKGFSPATGLKSDRSDRKRNIIVHRRARGERRERNFQIISAISAISAVRHFVKMVSELIKFHKSEAQALAYWQVIEASAMACGDGGLLVSIRHLLDGSGSRLSRWCSRTDKS